MNTIGSLASVGDILNSVACDGNFEKNGRATAINIDAFDGFGSVAVHTIDQVPGDSCIASINRNCSNLAGNIPWGNFKVRNRRAVSSDSDQALNDCG